MGRAKKLSCQEGLYRMLPPQSSFPDLKYYEAESSPLSSSSGSSFDNALWNEDFSHRPSWCDAGLAYQQIRRGRARGNTIALRLRALLQRFLFWSGCVIQRHFAIVLCVGLLLLVVLSVGLRSYSLETNIEKLWVEEGGRLDEERQFLHRIHSLQSQSEEAFEGGLSGDDGRAQYLVLIQTAAEKGSNILTEEELLLHSEVLSNISQLSVEMFGRTWTLADICFKPAAPIIENSFGDILKTILDRIIPCVIITPLDCFWEGSFALGPFPPFEVPLGVVWMLGLEHDMMSWRNLDPEHIIIKAKEFITDPDPFLSLFKRAGVEHGYLDRPCLDPLHEECPRTAPNYIDTCSIMEKFMRLSDPSLSVDDETNMFLNSSSNAARNIALRSVNGTVARTAASPVWNGTAFNQTSWTTPYLSNGVVSNTYNATFSAATTTVNPLLHTAQKRRECREKVRDWLKTHTEGLSAAGYPTRSTLNIGRTMTGGCKGFATNYMQWPEDLIVGGIKRQSGEIVKAEALQSVLMISSPSDIYHRFKDGNTNKKPPLDWSVKAADQILKAWQRNYTNFIYNYAHNSEKQDNRRLHPLAGTSVNDMLSEFSNFNPTVLIVGYVLMMAYAGLSLCSCAQRGVRSSVGLSLAGCLLVTLASAAGLGLWIWMGMKFNAATAQIVPFLTLGLGVDDMFLLIHNYKEIVEYVRRDEIGFLLKETGLSALLTSINNIVAFLAGVFIPVPALRDFCLQVAILLCFNAAAVLTLFPAVMTIDLDRRRKNLVDIFCCQKVNDKVQPRIAFCEYDNGGHIGNSCTASVDSVINYSASSIIGSMNGRRAVGSARRQRSQLRETCGVKHWTLHRFVKDVYVPLLCKPRVKVFVLLANCMLFGAGVIGFTRITMGLELKDVIPKGTAPYAFLDAREAYFSFYPFNAVLKGPIDYARNQVLMREFHQELLKLPYVVKSNDKLNQDESWLALMSRWLQTLQHKLDDDMEKEHITVNGIQRQASVSKEGRLAYKLLCNYGDTVNCSRIGMTRLVDREGLIEPEGFYNYLTAWYYSDQMTYYLSQASFYPTPPFWQNTEAIVSEADMKIPPATKTIFSQIPFFLTDLTDTAATVDMIKKVRAVCDNYTSRGLPVFPEGIPFTFWEQYLKLWQHLAFALGIIAGAVLIVVTALLVNLWIALIVVCVLTMMVVELAGFMGMIGLKLNPVSAVTLITAVGIGVEFTVHVSLSFLTTLGTRNERLGHTLDHMFIPVLHGGLSTLLGVIMLAFSEFEFVVRYFFMVMSALIALGLINGLLLLPVILSLIGPKSEVRTIDKSNRLAPPTPPPKTKPPPVPVSSVRSPAPTVMPAFRQRGSGVFIRQSDISLSTIAEEATPPSSVTPPLHASQNDNNASGQRLITVAPMQVIVHGNNTTDSPMTLRAKAKLEVQVFSSGGVGNRSEKQQQQQHTRRSTIGSCDAPPPYSSLQNNVPLRHSARKRNRSAGSVPSPDSVSQSSLLGRGVSSNSCFSSSSSQQSPVSTPNRQRIPSDSQAYIRNQEWRRP